MGHRVAHGECLPVRLSACPPVCLSARPPVRLSACPPVRLSTRAPVRLFCELHTNLLFIVTESLARLTSQSQPSSYLLCSWAVDSNEMDERVVIQG